MWFFSSSFCGAVPPSYVKNDEGVPLQQSCISSKHQAHLVPPFSRKDVIWVLVLLIWVEEATGEGFCWKASVGVHPLSAS